MNQMQVSSEDVRQYGSQINQMTAQASQIIQMTHNKMMGMSTIWDSPASRSLIQQFNSCRPVFDQYMDALQQYSVYLTQTANAYQENEMALQQGIR